MVTYHWQKDVLILTSIFFPQTGQYACVLGIKVPLFLCIDSARLLAVEASIHSIHSAWMNLKLTAELLI